MRDAFANRGHKTPGFQKKYGNKKELNVVIEDAVKEALKKVQDTSSGDASSEELEVFNASNDFCMLKIDSVEDDGNRAWHPPSRSPVGSQQRSKSYLGKKLGKPVEQLAINKKNQNSNFENKNHKNVPKQLTVNHECFMTTDCYDQKGKQLDNNTEKQLPLQPVLFGRLRVSRANQEFKVSC